MEYIEKKLAGGKSKIRAVIKNDRVGLKLKHGVHPSPEQLQLYRDTLDSYERARALYLESRQSPFPDRTRRVESLMKSAEENLRTAWRMLLQ